MQDTLFDKLVRGDIPSYRIWEDDSYLAFLTPFPNTEGACVVIPKVNAGDYIFAIDDATYDGLLKASRTVAKMLEQAFDTPRVAMVVEGTGVAYVHVKLYPLHGKLAGDTEVWSTHIEFYPEYVGYLTTVEGPKMDDQALKATQQRIIDAGN